MTTDTTTDTTTDHALAPASAPEETLTALTAHLHPLTARRVRAALTHLLDTARVRDLAQARYTEADAKFVAMTECEHVAGGMLHQPHGCTYCALDLDLEQQERNLARLDAVLDRRSL